MAQTPKMFNSNPPIVKLPMAKYTEYLALSNNADSRKILAHQLDLQTSKSNTDNPGYITIYNVSDYSTFSMTTVLFLHTEGITTEQYPAWIELTDAQMSDSVPEGIPGRTYLDENEDELVHTWTTWSTFYGRTPIDLSNGNKAIELSDGRKHFGSAEFTILAAVPYTVLDKLSLQAKLPTPEGL